MNKSNIKIAVIGNQKFFRDESDLQYSNDTFCIHHVGDGDTNENNIKFDIVIFAIENADKANIDRALALFTNIEHQEQILIIEKKYKDLITAKLSKIQELFIFAVSKMHENVILETMINAYEQSKYILNLRQDIRARQSAIGLIRSGLFQLKTPTEARNLSTMLSLLCPNSELVGTGLFEIILNAIEHGNLEIGSAKKQALIRENKLNQEIKDRLISKKYKDRHVTISFQEQQQHFAFEIKDQGQGFIFNENYDISDQLFSGRGIYIAKKICFDDLQYGEDGTLAIAKVDKR